MTNSVVWYLFRALSYGFPAEICVCEAVSDEPLNLPPLHLLGYMIGRTGSWKCHALPASVELSGSTVCAPPRAPSKPKE